MKTEDGFIEIELEVDHRIETDRSGYTPVVLYWLDMWEHSKANEWKYGYMLKFMVNGVLVRAWYDKPGWWNVAVAHLHVSIDVSRNEIKTSWWDYDDMTTTTVEEVELYARTAQRMIWEASNLSKYYSHTALTSVCMRCIVGVLGYE